MEAGIAMRNNRGGTRRGPWIGVLRGIPSDIRSHQRFPADACLNFHVSPCAASGFRAPENGMRYHPYKPFPSQRP